MCEKEIACLFVCEFGTCRLLELMISNPVDHFYHNQYPATQVRVMRGREMLPVPSQVTTKRQWQPKGRSNKQIRKLHTVFPSL